jgi:phage major head subunit gpT-like protein
MGLGLSSRAIIGRFYEIIESSKDKRWPFQIGMEFNSDQESETYKWLGMVPALREWIGGRNAKGLRDNGITIVNKKFEATLEIAVDDIRRDKTGQIDVRIGELADRVTQHWAKLLTTLITNTTAVCYDGQYFFDTDHSEGDSGTIKNLLTSSEVSELTVSTATAPTSAEMADIILGLIEYMYGFKDDQGEPYNEDAKKFLLMVPTNMWGAAVKAVTSNLLNNGSSTFDNPLKGVSESEGLSINVAHNPRLTGTTVCYLFRTDGRAKPFILQNEEDMKVSALAEGSDHEFKEDKHLYGVKALRNVGCGYWQHAVKATLST